MKKTLSLILTLMLALGCAFSFVSCGGNSEVAGTYELTSFAGSVTIDGVTTTLPADTYEYYIIVINEDGTGVEKAKSAYLTDGAEEKKDFEWELDGNKLLVSYKMYGVTITEEMTIENGVITSEAEVELAEGTSAYMKGTFTKK